MNSSNPGGVHAITLWLSAPHAPTPPPGFIRDVQPSTIRPSKHTEKSVSPSVVFAAARTDAEPSAAIQLRRADAPALAPMTPPAPTFAPMVPPAPATPHVPI
jgi:hypothetical protein